MASTAHSVELLERLPGAPAGVEDHRRPTGGCIAMTRVVAPHGEAVVLQCHRARGHALPHAMYWRALDDGSGPILIQWQPLSQTSSRLAI